MLNRFNRCCGLPNMPLHVGGKVEAPGGRQQNTTSPSPVSAVIQLNKGTYGGLGWLWITQVKKSKIRFFSFYLQIWIRGQLLRGDGNFHLLQGHGHGRPLQIPSRARSRHKIFASLFLGSACAARLRGRQSGVCGKGPASPASMPSSTASSSTSTAEFEGGVRWSRGMHVRRRGWRRGGAALQGAPAMEGGIWRPWKIREGRRKDRGGGMTDFF